MLVRFEPSAHGLKHRIVCIQKKRAGLGPSFSFEKCKFRRAIFVHHFSVFLLTFIYHIWYNVVTVRDKQSTSVTIRPCRTLLLITDKGG